MSATAGRDHPHWCDVTRCEPHGEPEDPERVHYSTGSTIPVQTNEVDVTVQLVHSDDFDRRVNAEVGSTRVRLVMQNWSFGPDLAETWLEPAEARLLSQLLATYAATAEIEPLTIPRCSADEARRRP